MCVLFANFPPSELGEATNRHWPDLAKVADAFLEVKATVNIKPSAVQSRAQTIVDKAQNVRMVSGYSVRCPLRNCC